MRITQGMLNQQMIFDIQGNNQRLSQLQEETATGKKINSPSDDPIGVGFVMQYNNQLAYYGQYQQNASQANGFLSFTDSTMNEAGQVMQRARDLAVQGSSDSMSAQDRQASASEVGQLYQQLVTIGNSQYNGQYIFNGQQTGTAPYDAENASAQSTNSGQVLYDLGNGVQLPVNVSGNNYFGAPSDTDNAFSILKQLQDALNNNDSAAIQSTIGEFDSRSNQMLYQRSDVGARSDRAQMMTNRLTDLTNNVTSLLSNTQDADMAQTIMQWNQANAVQQASLQAGAKVLQPTLVDFLK
jgi:flagellar hook-associated protein 3 FlgL